MRKIEADCWANFAPIEKHYTTCRSVFACGHDKYNNNMVAQAQSIYSWLLLQRQNDHNHHHNNNNSNICSRRWEQIYEYILVYTYVGVGGRSEKMTTIIINRKWTYYYYYSKCVYIRQFEKCVSWCSDGSSGDVSSDRCRYRKWSVWPSKLERKKDVSDRAKRMVNPGLSRFWTFFNVFERFLPFWTFPSKPFDRKTFITFQPLASIFQTVR